MNLLIWGQICSVRPIYLLCNTNCYTSFIHYFLCALQSSDVLSQWRLSTIDQWTMCVVLMQNHWRLSRQNKVTPILNKWWPQIKHKIGKIAQNIWVKRGLEFDCLNLVAWATLAKEAGSPVGVITAGCVAAARLQQLVSWCGRFYCNLENIYLLEI